MARSPLTLDYHPLHGRMYPFKEVSVTSMDAPSAAIGMDSSGHHIYTRSHSGHIEVHLAADAMDFVSADGEFNYAPHRVYAELVALLVRLGAGLDEAAELVTPVTFDSLTTAAESATITVDFEVHGEDRTRWIELLSGQAIPLEDPLNTHKPETEESAEQTPFTIRHPFKRRINVKRGG